MPLYIPLSDFYRFTFSPAHGPRGWFRLLLLLLWVLCIVTICWSTSPLDFRNLAPSVRLEATACWTKTSLCWMHTFMSVFCTEKGEASLPLLLFRKLKMDSWRKAFKLYVHETVFPLCLLVRLHKHYHCHVFDKLLYVNVTVTCFFLLFFNTVLYILCFMQMINSSLLMQMQQHGITGLNSLFCNLLFSQWPLLGKPAC